MHMYELMAVSSCPAGLLPAVISLSQTWVVNIGATCTSDAERPKWVKL